MTQPIFELLSNDAIAKELGTRCKKRRKELGLSRSELSKRSGVSTATISRFELVGVTTIESLIKLLRALDSLETLSGLLEPSRYQTIEQYLDGGDD